MHEIEKSLWKEELSCGGGTCYIKLEELGNYPCFWLISIYIINFWPN